VDAESRAAGFSGGISCNLSGGPARMTAQALEAGVAPSELEQTHYDLRNIAGVMATAALIDINMQTLEGLARQDPSLGHAFDIKSFLNTSYQDRPSWVPPKANPEYTAIDAKRRSTLLCYNTEQRWKER